jgi:hypothetical protein
MAKRKPDRMIQDPNPALSAVALDLSHDEIILQDENTFGINVYNRLDNTPPRARMTEPKRSIRGGATLATSSATMLPSFLSNFSG